MDFGSFTFQVSLPVLLAVAATIGYLVGRWRRSGEICPRCKKEMKQPVTT